MNKGTHFIIFKLLFLLSAFGISHSQDKTVNLRTFFPVPASAYNHIQFKSNQDSLNEPLWYNKNPCKPGTIQYQAHSYGALRYNLLYGCYNHPAWEGEWRILKDSWSYDQPDSQTMDIFPERLSSLIGIGTKAPAFQLSLDEDGGILSIGKFNAGDNLPTANQMPENDAKLLWYPKKPAFISGLIPSSNFQDSLIGNYSAALGIRPLVSAEGSMVLSGENNQITDSPFSTIPGGQINRITSSPHSTIAGGSDNIINNAEFNFIGGGSQNKTSHLYSTILGGNSNTTFLPSWEAYNAPFSTIGGGQGNWIADMRPNDPSPGPHHIIGGQNNSIYQWINSLTSNIGGGEINRIYYYAIPASIIGGRNNYIAGGRSFIGGGDTNQALRSASDIYNFIGGGRNNTSWHSNSYIIGGESNTLPTSGTRNGIIGGRSNSALNVLTMTQDYSLIGGGEFNEIKDGTIGGGSGNKSYAEGNFSIDYVSKRIVIGGGQQNIIGKTIDPDSGRGSFIMGGQNNQVRSYSSWVGGKNMQLETGSNFSFLWGHSENPAIVTTDPHSFIIYSGRVGIQTVSPEEKLHVNGTMRVQGTVMLHALLHQALPLPPSNLLNIAPIGGNTGRFDLAELFNTSETVDPGDILAIDPTTGFLKRSNTSYNRQTVGIVSTSPAMIFEGSSVIVNPQKKDISSLNQNSRALLALKGRVPVKVTLENGPIEPGDPLTTSSIPGHAMKATDPERSWGAVIGKALEGFSGGPNGETEGVIITFVTLY